MVASLIPLVVRRALALLNLGFREIASKLFRSIHVMHEIIDHIELSRPSPHGEIDERQGTCKICLILSSFSGWFLTTHHIRSKVKAGTAMDSICQRLSQAPCLKGEPFVSLSTTSQFLEGP
jgi:hypothetical protein